MSKPFVPTSELVELICADGSYMDGDLPGWGAGRWDEASLELILTYRADESDDLDPKYRGPYASTTRRFREVL